MLCHCVSIPVFAAVAGLYHWQMHSWGKGCCGVALVIWVAIRLHTAIEYVGMFGKISDALGTVLGAALVIVLIACGASTGAIGCHSH